MAADAWYPAADDYWVEQDQEAAYPYRYGDLFNTPAISECKTKKGQPWRAVLVVHPSCELGAKATDETEVLVARVYSVSDIGATQRDSVRAGWLEREGEILIAHASTFWMPTPHDRLETPDLYADFRRCQRVPLPALSDSGRVGAMSHDARLYLVRREIYFKYRWLVSLEDVRDHERHRISHDPDFAGPRPDWVGV